MEYFESLPRYIQFIMQYTALLFCISIHEASHALSAHLLGDDTSKDVGRISLNPIAHIDIFGTVIFPVIAFFTHIPVIGWAKPVHVNPINLRDPKRDDIFISAAGPASNLLTAFIFFAFAPLVLSAGNDLLWFRPFYEYVILINILLAFFNLIPIPPLDGSGILRGFLPDSMVEKYDRLGQFGFILIYFLLIIGVLSFFFSVGFMFYRAMGAALGISG